MARSSNVRRNPFRTCRKRRLATSNEDACPPWQNLPQDILTVIIMKLGIFDFLAFGSVCKSWRSESLSNRSTFFKQKEPLLVTLSDKVCTLTNIFDEGRRYRTELGTLFRGGDCVGVSYGYLIICQSKPYSDLYLVNPITRHELYFPSLPEKKPYFYIRFQAILVYSSWLSKPVVVILCRGGNRDHVMYSGPGDSEWVLLPIPDRGWKIVDLAFFKGKIYLLNSDGRIGEMKLNDALSSLKLLDVKRMPSLERKLVSSGEGERLFMADDPSSILAEEVRKHEIDFEKMEWVLREDVGDESLFYSEVNSSVVLNTSNWLGRGQTQYKSTYILPRGECYWYFPHECYSTNILTDS